MRLLAIIYALLVLGCTRNQFAGLEPAGDTTRAPVGTNIGKLKATTVIIQTGRGNNAETTNNTKAGQRNGTAAIGPEAHASNSTQKVGSPWWLYLLAAVAGAVGWEYFSPKLPLKWLPWRVGAG